MGSAAEHPEVVPEYMAKECAEGRVPSVPGKQVWGHSQELRKVASDSVSRRKQCQWWDSLRVLFNEVHHHWWGSEGNCSHGARAKIDTKYTTEWYQFTQRTGYSRVWHSRDPCLLTQHYSLDSSQHLSTTTVEVIDWFVRQEGSSLFSTTWMITLRGTIWQIHTM